MHFGLFFGGLSMLVGSCVIVCVCKKCKRRAVRKHMMGKNCQMRPPTVSFTIDKNAETAAYLNSIQITDSPMFVTKLQPTPAESPKSRCSSKDSCDSFKGLLGHKDSIPSPNWLEVPTGSNNWIKRTGPVKVPSIYIDPVCAVSSAA